MELHELIESVYNGDKIDALEEEIREQLLLIRNELFDFFDEKEIVYIVPSIVLENGAFYFQKKSESDSLSARLIKNNRGIQFLLQQKGTFVDKKFVYPSILTSSEHINEGFKRWVIETTFNYFFED